MITGVLITWDIERTVMGYCGNIVLGGTTILHYIYRKYYCTIVSQEYNRKQTILESLNIQKKKRFTMSLKTTFYPT